MAPSRFMEKWSYGNGVDGAGIFSGEPKQCEAHHYKESIVLGTTQMSEDAVLDLVSQMEPQWPGSDYDLRRRNWVLFTAEFAKRLGVNDVPCWVTDLAGASPTIQRGATQAATGMQAATTVAVAADGGFTTACHISGRASAGVEDLLQAVPERGDRCHLLQAAARVEGVLRATREIQHHVLREVKLSPAARARPSQGDPAPADRRGVRRGLGR